MKILLTGDWHSKKGLQAKLIIDYLDYLHSYCKKNNISWVFVLGDIFNKSSNIKNEAFVPLFLKLLEMKQDGINFIFLIGNHDIYNVDYDTLVDTFAPIGEVIKEYKSVDIEDETFEFLPYTKNQQDIPSSGQYLFTHVPIANFTFDNAFHATEKHAFEFDLFENFQMVFTGHFHRHQHIKNIVYVGAPNQLTRSDIGDEKGFVVLDTGLESWEFFTYDEAPKYVEIFSKDIKNIKSLPIEGNYIIVYIDEKIQDFSKLKYVLYEYGAIDIIPIFENNSDDIEVDVEIQKSDNLEDIVTEFILSIDDEEIETEKLLSIFNKVV